MKNKLIGLFVALIFIIGLLPVNAIDVNNWREGDVYLVVGSTAKSSDTAGGMTLAGSITPRAETILISGENIELKLNEILPKLCFDNSDLGFLEEEYTVEINDEKYDVEEKICLDRIVVGTSSVYSDDFMDEPLLVIPRNSIKYLVDMENDMEYDYVDDENSIVLNILNSEYKIVDINPRSFTYLMGKEYYIGVGDKVTANGEKVVEILRIGTNSIIVDVDGMKEIIGKGKEETDTVNGIKIMVNEIFYHNTMEDCEVLITVGEEIEVEIDNNDRVEGDEDWRWIVDFGTDKENVIGVKFYESLKADDEALSEGDSITFPENFAVITFESLNDVEYSEINFRLDEFEELVYLAAEGEFDGNDEIYFNHTGVYDENFVVIDVPLEIDGTDLKINAINELTTMNITIGDDMEIVYVYEEKLEVFVDGDNVGGSTYDIRSSYGIVVVNPKDGLSDQELTIKVPSKRLKATININNEKTTSTIVGGEELTIKGILDSDVSGSFETIVSIGGPAVNTVTKKYVGEWAYKPYEAIVELFKDGNKRILVVAGTNAADTVGACEVLAEYFKGKNHYFDDGTSFKVTGIGGVITVEEASTITTTTTIPEETEEEETT